MIDNYKMNKLIIKTQYYDMKYQEMCEIFDEYNKKFSKHFAKDLDILEKKNLLPKNEDNKQLTKTSETKENETPETSKKNLCRSLYKRLALVHHPDKSDNKDDSTKFQLVEAAYTKKDTIALISLCNQSGIEIDDILDETEIASIENDLIKKKKEMKQMKESIVWEWNTGLPYKKTLIEQKLKLMAIGMKANKK